MERPNDELKKIAQFIGNKIYLLRTESKRSQKSLGDVVGISAQQIGKYEKGDNNISVAKLILIANNLDVNINYFFDAIKNYKSNPLLETRNSLRNSLCFKVIQDFMQIKSRKQQEAISQLINACVLNIE